MSNIELHESVEVEEEIAHPTQWIGSPDVPKYAAIQLPGKTLDEKWHNLMSCFAHQPFSSELEGKTDDITYYADRMNWLIGSTSGIHGSYTSLDDIENPDSQMHQDYAADDDEFDMSNDEAFTFIVIQPRICRLIYGTIGFRDQADLDWVRRIISESIHEINESQKENIS